MKLNLINEHDGKDYFIEDNVNYYDLSPNEIISIISKLENTKKLHLYMNGDYSHIPLLLEIFTYCQKQHIELILYHYHDIGKASGLNVSIGDYKPLYFANEVKQ